LESDEIVNGLTSDQLRELKEKLKDI